MLNYKFSTLTVQYNFIQTKNTHMKSIFIFILPRFVLFRKGSKVDDLFIEYFGLMRKRNPVCPLKLSIQEFVDKQLRVAGYAHTIRTQRQTILNLIFY